MSAPESGNNVIPPLTETTTLRRLVEYAGASGDFYEMHYDLDFAHALGHPELAVHGLLKAAYLGRLVTEWLGGRGRLAVLEVSYRGMDFRDRAHTCRGRVVSTQGGRAELELWGEDDTGRRTTLGRAEVIYDEETS
ncbi:MaoC like domain-containing protein [Nonomuraea solani]|uniref:MaoC like domain-containing protein n=1 Tax=Nonomuraea solani TaxID=1144553 RepID=A0A1H5ZG56_9ACTN|nr:MaoC/PaaZ C-terminal domain-containing protein [Nonomuraea solani]SEG34617.1 MaoC like domain-containing protein [Nonomuraea solani]